ncbi:MAG: nucleotide sugar dehydrogenase [Myxococcales bacterium]|jgi:UDP-N-acetyl-D-glucosamine dehydrogenase|nr:nucleotide sugar dehydrogenase [Myxococcales bacterium]
MRQEKWALLDAIAARRTKVGVVGLGYVGLPLSMAFGNAGFRVLGLDIDARKVEAIEKGECYFRHLDAASLAWLAGEGRLIASQDFQRAAELDCVVICVPTPLTRQREPDMSFIVETARALAPHVRPGQLFVLESTTWPGTTEEIVRPILESGGLKAGVDFHLAFSPEREDPGVHASTSVPKLVGGLSPDCLELACALYATVVPRVVPLSSTRAAEMAKLLENIFRAVNIALVNELKMLCDRMGLDVWEIIDAAATKGFGFMAFQPGPGLGGHCIPIDPFYLTWKAREFELQTRFIELAGEINTQMPRYVVHRTQEALNARERALRGARVLVLGVAYKKDVDDLRESPALRVIELLMEGGAEVRYHDPHIAQLGQTREHSFDLSSVPLDEAAFEWADVVMILTDHSDVDYGAVVRGAKLIVDTRNATRGLGGTEHVVRA